MLKSILELVFSLIAPIILMVVGAFIIGLGIHMEWDWMTNAGIFVAALGVLWTARMWWAD